MARFIRRAGAVLAAFFLLCLVPRFDSSTIRREDVPNETIQGKHLRTLFDRWREGPGGPPVLSLSWSKGFSTRFVDANGTAMVDREQGYVSVRVHGDTADLADVWLVSNRPGPGRSVQPEPGDFMLKVGRLEQGDSRATLFASLPIAFTRHLDVDLIVVTARGLRPDQDCALVGVPTLFQRLEERLWSLGHELDKNRASTRPLVSALGPPPVFAAAADLPSLSGLVERGEDLFFNETFDGNGRTCGTCHPAENNFTIDPEFIASLPFTDPLFVAELNPALGENFENPKLMRQLGLILENADGFDDLSNKFTMRGVPHILGIVTSLQPAPNGADGTTTPPDQRTGWSGDGSPGSGTLREFAIGAVVQHLPRTLSRTPGMDFRLPTDEELDALEAFQLTVGRQDELSLPELRLKSPRARRGQEIFLTADSQGGSVAAGKCNQCHANAGANVSFVPGGFNFNFDTGVEALEDHPADLIDPGRRPPDGGFGTEPHPTRSDAFGNGTFNTVSLVEAADTPPFFHNSALTTLEEAVNFYNSRAFNDSPAGRALAGNDSGAIGIRLEATQVEAVAAFLRVINVLENIRSASDLVTRALDPADQRARLRVGLAIDDIDDAVSVLEEGGLHPDAVVPLLQARGLVKAAMTAPDEYYWVSYFFKRALRELRQARKMLAE